MTKDEKELYEYLVKQLNDIHNSLHLIKEALFKHFLMTANQNQSKK